MLPPSDGKIPSNFESVVAFGAPVPTGTPGTQLPPPPTDEIITVAAPDGSIVQGQAINLTPPEPPTDYRAKAEGVVYQLVTKYGATESMDVNVSMSDKDNGSGKASIIIGKDINKRKFEIPIEIKSGTVSATKAIDLDTNNIIPIADAKKMFEPPPDDVVKKRFLETYEKHLDLFKGRPTDKKAKALIKRFPSLKEDKARTLLETEYDARKGVFFAAMDKAKDAIDIKTITIIGAAVAALVMTVIWKKKVVDDYME